MIESNGPRTDQQAARRSDVRRHATQALHHLAEALAADDSEALVALLGEADVELTAARNETLRGQL